jgi:hypothetical protein
MSSFVIISALVAPVQGVTKKTFFCKNITYVRQNAEYFKECRVTSSKMDFVKYGFCNTMTRFSYLNFYSLAVEYIGIY